MIELDYLGLILQRLAGALRALRDERGSPAIETVLITAGLAALAIAIVAIIAAKVTSTANNIPTK